MYVSQINYSTPSKSINKVSKTTKQQLSFKSYQTTFDSIYRNHKSIRTYEQLVSTTQRLISSLFAEQNISLNRGADIVKNYQNEPAKIIKKLENNDIYGTIVSKRGEPLLIKSDALSFYDGTKDTKNISVKPTSNGADMEFSISDEYSSDTSEFYYLGGIKKRNHVSGSGYGTVSKTVYYDRDGSENGFRNFLNDVFGL